MKSTCSVAAVSVKTGFRLEPNDFGPDRFLMIPTVELWVGGRKFTMDCDSEEHARQQVLAVARDLGIPH